MKLIKVLRELDLRLKEHTVLSFKKHIFWKTGEKEYRVNDWFKPLLIIKIENNYQPSIDKTFMTYSFIMENENVYEFKRVKNNQSDEYMKLFLLDLYELVLDETDISEFFELKEFLHNKTKGWLVKENLGGNENE